MSFKCPKYHFYGKSLSFLMQPCCVPRGLFFVALGSSLRRNKGSWAWMLVAKGLATREHGDLWKPVSLVYFLGKFEKFSANFFGNHLKDQTELDNYNKRFKKKKAQTFGFAWHVCTDGGTTSLECLEDGHAKYEASLNFLEYHYQPMFETYISSACII